MEVSIPLVEKLIATQFPEWAELSLIPVDKDGHDNRTIRLDSEMSVRMPKGRLYADHVDIEFEWLPKLAPNLPLRIPTPIAKGDPGFEYPWAWTVNKWIPGDTPIANEISDLNQFATDLAHFLKALQEASAIDAPEPGPNNFYRGGKLSTYDKETRESLNLLNGEINSSKALWIWKSAIDLKCNDLPMWVHGDMATSTAPGSYSLVFLVYNTISNLLTQGEQVSCFHNAASHLEDGGRFVVELWVPELRKLTPGQQAVVGDSAPGYIGVDTYDTLNQRLVSHHFQFEENGQAQVFRSPHRYIWPSELDLMANLAGFELESRHADWVDTPFTSESPSHVSVYRLGDA